MNTMTYKGYLGSVNYSDKDQVFFGKIEGINGLVNFEGESVKELTEAFHEAVDDYLAYCNDEGIEPDKSYTGVLNVRLTPAIHRQIAIQADCDHLLLSGIECVIQVCPWLFRFLLQCLGNALGQNRNVFLLIRTSDDRGNDDSQQDDPEGPAPSFVTRTGFPGCSRIIINCLVIDLDKIIDVRGRYCPGFGQAFNLAKILLILFRILWITGITTIIHN